MNVDGTSEVQGTVSNFSHISNISLVSSNAHEYPTMVNQRKANKSSVQTSIDPLQIENFAQEMQTHYDQTASTKSPLPTPVSNIESEQISQPQSPSRGKTLANPIVLSPIPHVTSRQDMPAQAQVQPL